MITTLSFPESCGLDPDQLAALRYENGKFMSQCPSCAADGKDTKQDNLAVFDDGSYHCIVGCDTKQIHALAGRESDWKPDPLEERRWKKEQAARRSREEKLRILSTQAKERRQAIIERHQWTREEILADSPQDIARPLITRFPDRYLLMTLFDDDDILWTGECNQTGVWKDGTTWPERWRKAYDHRLTDHSTGPMTTPSTWKPGIIHRTSENVAKSPFTVLDFDGFDGIKPETPDQLRDHLNASSAIIRWICEGLNWKLAAIVFTGSKSLHAWFHTPPQDVLQSLKDIAPELGIDAGLIGQPAHPCRLPGHRHEKTGNLSRLLWLQAPDKGVIPSSVTP